VAGDEGSSGVQKNPIIGIRINKIGITLSIIISDFD
jgi:hypothetical protein